MKKIRFNLQNNGKSLRTVNELGEDFNFDDLLNSYNSGELFEWLIRQGDLIEHSESELARITNESSPEALFELIRSLGINVSKEDEIWYFEREKIRSERAEQLERLNQIGLNRKSVLQAYFEEYATVFKSIVQGEVNGYPQSKAVLKQLSHDFSELFIRDFATFFNLAAKNNLWAILAALADCELAVHFSAAQKKQVAEKLIENLLVQEGIAKEVNISGPEKWQTLTDRQAKILSVENSYYSTPKLMVSNNKEIQFDGNEFPDSYVNGIRAMTRTSATVRFAEKHPYIEVRTLKGNVSDNWRSLETDGKFMVLSFEGAVSCKGIKDSSPELTCSNKDSISQFPIFSGLQCKTRDYKSAKIYYMRIKHER